MTGRPSYRCVSSASVGMDVVRALGGGGDEHIVNYLGGGTRMQTLDVKTHLTTTIENSGGGGAVLRYGVFGLWRW
jgi:hypothetical protein